MEQIFEEMRDFFPLKIETPKEWAEFAIQDFDKFIVDHANCERKAAATCLSFVGAYPEKFELCDVMITVAREEMEHFQQAFRVARNRGLQLKADQKDPYVNLLLKEVRTGREARFLDKLLVSGIVEARSCERLGLIGEALRGSEDANLDELSKYYSQLAVAEARHFGLFIKFAERYFDAQIVAKRLSELLDIEAIIVNQLPWRPAVH